jgi:hypothetical protein
MEELSMQMRHGERKGITAVFVFFATLVVISAVKGQQIPVVPGGAHFPESKWRVSNVQHNRQRDRSDRTLFSELGG